MSEPSIKGGTFKSVGHLKGMFSKSAATLIQNVPADNTKVVRFLTEPDNWFAYQEYWDNEMRRYIPVVEGVEPPVRPSQRFLAQVVDRESDQVIALKMPKDLANRLVVRYERYQTIMDRDYEIMRSGKGLDTTYDVTPEPASEFDSSKYTKIDLLDILQTAYKSSMGNDSALFADKPKTKPSNEEVDFVADDESVEDDNEEAFFEDVDVETEDETAKNIAAEKVQVETPTDDGTIWHFDPEIWDEMDKDETFETVDDFETFVLGDEKWTEEELEDLSTVDIREMCDDRGLKHVGKKKAGMIKLYFNAQENYLVVAKKEAVKKGFYPSDK